MVALTIPGSVAFVVLIGMAVIAWLAFCVYVLNPLIERAFEALRSRSLRRLDEKHARKRRSLDA